MSFKDLEEDDSYDFIQLRKAFRMFSTENEAQLEADKFAQNNEIDAIDAKINLAKEKLDKVQKTYDNLLKKREKLLKKKSKTNR